MYTHLIFVSKCDDEKPYKIAFDEVFEEGAIPTSDPLESIRGDKELMKKISLYMQSVDGNTVYDLLCKDPYFRGMRFCKTAEEFIAQARD